MQYLLHQLPFPLSPLRNADPGNEVRGSAGRECGLGESSEKAKGTLILLPFEVDFLSVKNCRHDHEVAVQ